MAAVNRAVEAARDLSALLDEQWPTGTFGGARPYPAPRPDPEAPEHVAALRAGIAAPLHLRRTDQTMTSLPDGYYALLDPQDPDVMTYWRVRSGRMTAWPAKAWHGPARPLARDAPKDREQRIAWMREWHSTYQAWMEDLHRALLADPGTARRQYADLTVRCCQCGRALHDDVSKVVGIGPDCRSGMSQEALAALFMPPVATAHAAQIQGGAA
ncbi:DUF6011 domain-containing protein [Streptomyces californicus]|uniref:DUF6011 domain-containing protein n=1 Tax=Streptomyces californicus TaxID=67351 RepID=UPI00371844C8